VQFAHLARQIYLGTIENQQRRLDQVADDIGRRRSVRDDAFTARRATLHSDCLQCGTPLVDTESIAPAGYYCETSDRATSGYLEEDCFASLVFPYFYRSRRQIDTSDPLRDLFRESAQRSYFVLRRAPNTRGHYQQQLSFYRFDEEGLEISHKIIELTELNQSGEQDPLPRLGPLLQRTTLLDRDNRLRDTFLLIRRVSSDFAEEILYEEQYRQFRHIADKITAQLPAC
jgi:hypothetical protein